jgi:hypothetical protein
VAAQEQAAAGEPPKQRRRPSFALVGQVGAVVGLVAGIVGLIFTFAPGLRPEQAAAPSGRLEVADVNDRATLREYLGAEGIATGSLAPWVLRRVGVLTTVRYTVEGLDGKSLPLVVSLTSRETGVIACKHTYTITPSKGAPPTFRVWTPFPARLGPPGEAFNLHVTLFPPGGKPPHLDAIDRNGIAGLGRAQPGPAAAELPVALC